MSKLGKRKFKRVSKDFYPTPLKALEPLLPFLEKNLKYCEPCAGAYDLVNNLQQLRPDIECKYAFDIFPQHNNIIQKSALFIKDEDIGDIDCFITNPPFKWEMFEPIAEHLISLRPTWFLIPADYMHNKRMSKLMERCKLVVSVGRIKWFEGSKATSTDNFCWYLFDKFITDTKFIAR